MLREATIEIHTLSDINSASRILAGLFDPRQYDKKNIVVCSLGVKGAGKSTTFEAVKKELAVDSSEGNLRLIGKDYGNSTYPWDEDQSYIYPSARQALCGGGDKPTLFVVEHPPVNMFAFADFVLVFSAPRIKMYQGVDNGIYLKNMSRNLENSMDKIQCDNEAFICDAVEMAIKKMRKERARRCGGRTITIILTSKDPQVCAKFAETAKILKRRRAATHQSLEKKSLRHAQHHARVG